MTVIPTYGLPKVQTAPVPNARIADTASPASFGVPANIDVSGVANIVNRQVQEQQDAADNAVITNKEVELSDLRTAQLVKATTALGVNALPASQSVREEWDKGVAGIMGSLTNDRQKKLIAQRAQGYWANLHEAVESHVGAQMRKQAATDVDALLGKELDAVVHDPTQAPVAIAQAKARLTDYGRFHAGWTPAELQDQIASRVSTIHATAISQWTAANTPQSTAMAKAYFDQHASELVGKQYITAKDQVTDAVDQTAGIEAADRILGINQLPIDPAQQLSQEIQQGPATSRADALRKAESIKDPKVRKSAITQIMAHYRDLDALEHMDRQQSLVDVTKQLEDSGGRLNTASAAYQSIRGHPEEQVALAHQRSILHPPPDPGDPAAFMSTLMGANLSPATQAEFLAQSPANWGGMNMSQQTQLVRLQSQIRGAAQGRALTAATADVLHYKREYESALAKGDRAAAAMALSLRVDAQETLDRIKGVKQTGDEGMNAPGWDTPSAKAGTVQPQQGSAPAGPINLTPAMPPIQATRQMIEEAAQSPAYARMLRDSGVVLPRMLPIPKIKP